MNKKFIDSIYLKSDSTRQAATLITQIAYRFGFRACTGQNCKKEYPEHVAYTDQTWEVGSGWDTHFKYIKSRLDRLLARTRPSKKVLIGLIDLRTSKLKICYECTLKTEKNKTWTVCDPTEVVTDLEELK